MRGGDETYYGWTAVELAIEATRHVPVVALLRTLGARVSLRWVPGVIGGRDQVSSNCRRRWSGSGQPQDGRGVPA